MTRPPFIRLHLTIILLFAAAMSLAAQDVIDVFRLTQGERGAQVRVPVSGTIMQSGTSQVTFSYPADVIRVLGVVGGQGFAYRCDTLLISSNSIVGSARGEFTVQCADVLTTTGGPLFEVIVEILRGPGTVGPMVATALVLNGVPVPSAVFVSGDIEAIGNPPVLPNATQGFTGNYPNPFAGSSAFIFQMKKAGTVHMSILNMHGRLVKDLGTINVTAGENRYDFVVGEWELAQGAYMMQMIAEQDQYLHAFMVLK